MMGRLRPEFGSGVRSFTVENHVIYYRHNVDIQIALSPPWPARSGRCLG